MEEEGDSRETDETGSNNQHHPAARLGRVEVCSYPGHGGGVGEEAGAEGGSADLLPGHGRVIAHQIRLPPERCQAQFTLQ